MGDPPDKEPPDRNFHTSPPSPAAFEIATDLEIESQQIIYDENKRSSSSASRKRLAKEHKPSCKKNRNCLTASRESSTSSVRSVYSAAEFNLKSPDDIPLAQTSLSQQIPLGQASNIGLSSCSAQSPMEVPSSLSLTNNSPSQTPIVNKSQPHRIVYTCDDVGPFVVHVEKVEVDLQSGTTLHPVNFGKLLFKNKIPGVINGSLKKIGRNRVCLTFNHFNNANMFMANPFLSTNSYKAFIPSFAITKMGFVRGVPTDWTEEDILELFVGSDGCGKIVKTRRLHRKTDEGWKQTQSVILTFDGQILPSKVFAVYNSFSVTPYKFPTVQCFACCRFGHTQTKCRSKPRCYKCSLDHPGESCGLLAHDSLCINCQGNHFAIDKSCPEYSRQNAIKSTMVEQTISYSEASKIHLPVKKSFADVARSYKKTIFKKPRSPPSPGFGYDKVAHNNIIAQGPSPSGNGVALQANHTFSFQTEELVQIIMSVLSSLNQKIDHVAPPTTSISTNNHNAQPNTKRTIDISSMELPKHPQ